MPKIRQPNISRAKEVLGWPKKIDRVDGLQKTFEYFKEAVEV